MGAPRFNPGRALGGDLTDNAYVIAPLTVDDLCLNDLAGQSSLEEDHFALRVVGHGPAVKGQVDDLELFQVVHSDCAVRNSKRPQSKGRRYSFVDAVFPGALYFGQV